MQKTLPVIDSAKACALAQFASLARRSREDATVGLAQSLSIAGGAERAALAAARTFLEEDGAILDKRLGVLFDQALGRAVQTMYSRHRPGLDHFSADSLSLIDDETVNRDIEVDRFVVRLREADRESLGRINLMIAQIHEEYEVRERENPFRPYLIARTLHDALCELVPQPATRALLFERLADALCQHLPEYFLAIRRVFEAGGIEARLTVVPSQFDLRQRDRMQDPMLSGAALPSAVPATPVESAPPLSPGMTHLLTLLSQALGLTAAPDGLSDALRRMFGMLPRHAAQGVAAPQVRPSVSLMSCLRRQQALAVADVAPDPGWRAELVAAASTRLESVLVGVVAAVFDVIEATGEIPVGLRAPLACLHAPFLKAVLLAPDLLQHPAHPARRLLNRLVSAAMRRDPDAPSGMLLTAETVRIVRRVLDEYDEDAATFAQCADEFDRFVVGPLARAEPAAGRCIEALERAVLRDKLPGGAAALIGSRLASLPIDPAVAAFLTGVWPRVLAQIASDDGIDAPACREAAELVPDLIWSTQPKLSQDERRSLLGRLPALVGILRGGMRRTGMTENEIERQTSLLADAHAGALRGDQAEAAPALSTRDALHRLFSGFLPDAADAAPAARPDDAALRHALALPDLTVSMHLDGDPAGTSAPADAVAELLAGAAAEYRCPEGWQPLRLIWTDPHRTLFLFGGEDAQPLELYDAPALAQALSRQLLRPAEAMPVFDRAVQTLLAGAGAFHPRPG